jgi:anti-anti-sigma factor
MTVSPGNVRVLRLEQTVTFRVEGRGTMTHSLPLRRFAENCLAGGATTLRVDLRHCTYMDSTFLGTLLTLQGAVNRQPPARLTLISPSPACAKILHQMGLTAIFCTETADERADLPWADLPAAGADVNSVKRNVVEAHEELANLPGSAGEPFRAVVRCMAQSASTEKPAPKPEEGGASS